MQNKLISAFFLFLFMVYFIPRERPYPDGLKVWGWPDDAQEIIAIAGNDEKSTRLKYEMSLHTYPLDRKLIKRLEEDHKHAHYINDLWNNPQQYFTTIDRRKWKLKVPISMRK